MALSFSGIGGSPKEGVEVQYVKLVDSAAAVTDGEWFDTSNVIAINFDVQGISGETVHVRGSNESAKPLDTAHERLLTTAITADGFYKLDRHEIPMWTKVRVETANGGTIIVWAKIWRQN